MRRRDCARSGCLRRALLRRGGRLVPRPSLPQVHRAWRAAARLLPALSVCIRLLYPTHPACTLSVPHNIKTPPGLTSFFAHGRLRCTTCGGPFLCQSGAWRHVCKQVCKPTRKPNTIDYLRACPCCTNLPKARGKPLRGPASPASDITCARAAAGAAHLNRRPPRGQPHFPPRRCNPTLHSRH